MMLNFVGGSDGAGEDDEKGLSSPARSKKPGVRPLPPGGGGGSDGDETNGDISDESSTAESSMWRGRGNTYNERVVSRGALDTIEPAHAGGDDEPLKESASDKNEVDDRVADGEDEARLYSRTLGSSVSVLDEKDAVLRTGGLRFAGEDPMRGRLRAMDPFLWMGRLNAGTSAISGLIGKANDALKTLDGGSGGSDSDTSDGRSSGRKRVDRMQDIRTSRKDVVGPSSGRRGKSVNEQEGKRRDRGEITAPQHLGSTAEDFNEGVGTDNDGEKLEDPGGMDLSCAASDRVSGNHDGAVKQLSSTMSAYSRSVEANGIIAGGVVIEEEEEEEDRERDENVRYRTIINVMRNYVSTWNCPFYSLYQRACSYRSIPCCGMYAADARYRIFTVAIAKRSADFISECRTLVPYTEYPVGSSLVSDALDAPLL